MVAQLWRGHKESKNSNMTKKMKAPRLKSSRPASAKAQAPRAGGRKPNEAMTDPEKKPPVPAHNGTEPAQPAPGGPLADPHPDTVSPTASYEAAPPDETSSTQGMSEALAKARAIEWQLRGPHSPDPATRQLEELHGILETILGHLGTQAAQLQAQESRLSDLHRQLSDVEAGVSANRTSR
jgi:hypothetical protein